MRVRYLIKLDEPIRLEDHWPIPILDGNLRVISQGGKASAFEITFVGQPVNLAPRVEEHEEGEVKASITICDSLLPFVRMQMEKAFTYLQCYFDVEILIDEIESAYEGETDEEEKQIKLKKYRTNKAEHPAHIPYNLLTRAMMAAEGGKAPEFEATLVSASRKAMRENRYIDSFRYSFLLIESLYGEGKFKSIQLKDTLKASSEFNATVGNALRVRMSPKRLRNSDTEKLLSQSPAVERVIDHLVDMRGFYFHGNRKRRDAWQPHEQEKAEALCLLALEIAMLISHEAAAPMFDDAFSQRHFEQAKQVGAIMTMKVNFKFNDPADGIDRNESMNINVPGTRPTPKMATYVAKSFLERFEDVAPVADLKSAVCTVEGTGQKVFELTFHIDPVSDEKTGVDS